MKTYYAINDPSKFNEVINYYDKSLGCTIVFNDSKKLKVLYDALLNSKDFSIAINRKHGFTIKDADVYILITMNLIIFYLKIIMM